MRGSLVIRLLFLAGVVALVTLASHESASAQPIPTFTVNATHDAVDASPGDGVCADATGACTLRAAIMETNALSEYSTILLNSGTYTLELAGAGEDAAATGDLDVTGSIVIYGAGSKTTIVDGNGLDRVFDMQAGGGAALESMTIRNGSTAAMAGTPDDRGGGILIRGSAMLWFAVVTGNEAGVGGGIFNEGSLEIPTLDVEIRNNRATAAASGAGGGIYNSGTVHASSGLISNNSANTGGSGIHNTGNLGLENLSVVGNSGGVAAIYNDGGELTMKWSSISGTPGGGIYSSGSATIESTTISGNVDALVAVDGAITSLTDVTIAGNQQRGISTSSTTRIVNTIVANSSGADCSGQISSLGHNLDSDGTCLLNGPGDISNTDPKLGPLEAHNASHFQTTLAHVLLAGSPAIDAGDNNGCRISDQRRFPRPQDGNGDGIAVCDIGAFEADALAQTPEPTSPSSPDPTVAPTTTPIQPVDVPRTGGPAADSGGLPLTVMVGAMTAMIAAALSWRVLRKR